MPDAREGRGRGQAEEGAEGVDCPRRLTSPSSQGNPGEYPSRTPPTCACRGRASARDAGISTNRPCLTRLISCSAMPSSGGLMKSSALFTNRTGRGDLLEVRRRIVVARRRRPRRARRWRRGVAMNSPRPSRRAWSAASRRRQPLLVSIGAEPATARRSPAIAQRAARLLGVLAALPRRVLLDARRSTILRHSRLRPAIATGRQASGMTASIASGHARPTCHECMQPIDVPITSRR